MTLLRLFSKASDRDLKPLTDRLDKCESDLRMLRLEWAETYDKISHAVERWSKRMKSEKPPEPENGQEFPRPAEGRLYTEDELWRMVRKSGG